MNLGLSLSGGGFRATLFHLGVVRSLKDAGLLEHVTHVCSVSGGSILAAHLVQNWDRYQGSNADFDEAASEIVRFTQIDVRGRIIRRMLTLFPIYLLPPLQTFAEARRWTALDLLEKYYSTHLYRGKKLAEIEEDIVERCRKQGTPPPPMPRFHILATNMKRGGPCSFTNEGFTFDPVPGESGRHGWTSIRAGLTPLALAVAASSAYPGMFPPLRLTKDRLQCEDEKDLLCESQLLTDGGVFDNLGVRKFQQLFHESERESADQSPKAAPPDRILVSDAGRSINSLSTPGSPFFLLGNATRASDILMSRIRDLEREHARPCVDSDRLFHFIDVTAEVDKAAYPQAPHFELQAKTAPIRTDLDPFSPAEIRALSRHGYWVARMVVDRDGLADEEERPACDWDASTLLARGPKPRKAGGRSAARSGRSANSGPTTSLADPGGPAAAAPPSWFTASAPRFGSSLRTILRSSKILSTTAADRIAERFRRLRTLQRMRSATASQPKRPARNPKHADLKDAESLRWSGRRKWRVFSPWDWVSWMQMLILISVLVMTLPWVVNTVDSLRNALRYGHYIHPEGPLPEIWAPMPETVVDDLQNPEYSGFRFEWDSRLFDLRRWKMVPLPYRDADPRIDFNARQMEPAFLTRKIRLRKVEPRDEIRFQFETTGTTGYFRLGKTQAFPSPKLERARHKHQNGDNLVTRWDLVVDVSKIKVDEPFDLTIEAIYWNAWQAGEKDWAATKLEDNPPQEVSLWVIFPPGKPYKTINRTHYPNTERKSFAIAGGEILEDRDHRNYYWRITDVRANHTYRLDWLW